MHHTTRKGVKVNPTEYQQSIQPSFRPEFTANTTATARYGTVTARDGVVGSRVPALRIVAVLVLTIVLFAVAASAALGAQHHSYSYSFGSPGSGAGQLSLIPGTRENSGIAVNDATHDLYVADTLNNRVDEFSAAGVFIGAWGWGVADGKQELETCVITCQAGIESQEPRLYKPRYIAVDNSAGPSKGDVYVAGYTDVFRRVAKVAKFTSTGELVSTWGTDGELDGSTTPGGPMEQIRGITISASGDLLAVDNNYFLDRRRLVVFTQSGSFQEELEFHKKARLAIEVDLESLGIVSDDSSGPSSGDIYAMGAAEPPVAVKFSATTQFLGEVDPERSVGLAVDSSNGDLYVGHAADVATYDSTGNPLARFGSAEPSGGELRAPTGLAVDPSDHTVFLADAGSQRIDVFVSVTTPGLSLASATNIERESASVTGTINPGGTTPDAEIKECRFEYVEDSVLQAHASTLSTNEIFADYGTSSACLNPGGSTTAPLAPDTAEHSVHADLAGLHPGTLYDLRLLARNVNLTESTPSGSFTTLYPFVPATVQSPFASGVSSSSVVLEAEVNPNHYATAYHFEYVDNATYEADLASGNGFEHASRVPAAADAVLGATGAVETVRQLVVGLASATTYRYRLVADNGHGETLSVVQDFVTQSAVPTPVLLDGRVWEMVSPPEKGGSTILGNHNQGGALQASADGNGLAYYTDGPFGQEARSNRSLLPSQFLAFRGTTGWSTKDITTPRENVVGLIPGKTEGYKVFSRDLSFGAVQPRGYTLLSPLATAPTPYLRAANGDFLPLVDSVDVPPGTLFDGEENEYGSPKNEPELVGGSPDLHSVVIASCSKLTEGAVDSCGAGSGRGESLYVWREGGLQLVSVLPNEQAAAGISELGLSHLTRHAVSEDGARVVFTDGDLYLRDMMFAKTVQLDQPEQGAVGGEGSPQFVDMNADGSKVFFTDTARLTTDSKADNSHPDLYMCEILAEGEELACALKNLSVARDVGEAGAVLGELGADSRGRYVYFAANGALTRDATPGDCRQGAGGTGTGTCGLYLYDTVADTIKLVTMLSGADYKDWAGTMSSRLTDLTARVSPNGRFLAFMSQRSLTGYDNRDAVSGRSDMEVFLYDRLGDGGEGKLVCASCNPTGAKPHGVEIMNSGFSLLNEGEGMWEPGIWLAAEIPSWNPYDLSDSLYQTRYLSDSGRLFFNSVDALVPRDSNGTTDVYEYEPPQGEGQPASNNCAASSPTYSSISGGCVDLVSSGASPEESVFLDASESGDDVFLLTASQLARADFDTALDIYDARVGGVVSEAVKPPACEGDACQNPVSPPEDPTPGSLTFKGSGNPLFAASASVQGKAKPSTRAQKLARALKACARRSKRKRAACERRVRRAYGPVGKARKSNRKAKRSNGRGQ